MHRPHSRLGLVAMLALVAAMLVVLFATPARAHTALVASTPAEGQTYGSLDEVRLEFTGALLEIGAELVIVDAAGAEMALVPAFPEVAVVVAPVEGLSAGDYTLRWRIVAEDGHPIEGVIAFAMDGTPPTSPSTSPSADPSATPTVAPSAVAVPSPSAVADSPQEPATEDSLPWWLLAAIGVAVAAGAGVALSSGRLRARAIDASQD